MVGDEMKLNLGCGKDTKEEYLNIDIKEYRGVDMLYDLNDIPYPFDDNSVDEIRAIDILEHLDDPIAQLEEWWRICKPGARIKIQVPHYRNMDAYTDLTHKHFFTRKSLDYFDPSKQYCKKYPRYSHARFDVRTKERHRLLAYIFPWIGPASIEFNLNVLKE